MKILAARIVVTNKARIDAGIRQGRTLMRELHPDSQKRFGRSSVLRGAAAAVLATLITVTILAVPSRAESTELSAEPATHGDAQAVLAAFGSGGWAAFLRGGVVAAPTDNPQAPRVQIRPFNMFDGRHYCQLDWHTILFADIEGGDNTFTEAAATATINGLQVVLVLDGAPASLTQTEVSRFLNPVPFGMSKAFYSQWGKVLAPHELTVGTHTLRGRMNDTTGAVLFDNTISFVIDPAGTGACATTSSTN